MQASPDEKWKQEKNNKRRSQRPTRRQAGFILIGVEDEARGELIHENGGERHSSEAMDISSSPFNLAAFVKLVLAYLDFIWWRNGEAAETLEAECCAEICMCHAAYKSDRFVVPSSSRLYFPWVTGIMEGREDTPIYYVNDFEDDQSDAYSISTTTSGFTDNSMSTLTSKEASGTPSLSCLPSRPTHI
ncbi:hypothetical protein BDV93DRAFT_505311 [Ceratobasidium sp. AG-I]|nr:hypothetical protein BDV93DRAFT_505311 [Ceratobasidium sp. AG-I]